MNIKAKGYRKLIGMTQKQLANVFGISVQALRNKEREMSPYSDREKMMFKELIRKSGFPDITIDEIFFN